jgi:hypothetical protein
MIPLELSIIIEVMPKIRPEPNKVEERTLQMFQSVRLLPLTTNIRLGWKGSAEANTDTITIPIKTLLVTFLLKLINATLL